MSLTKELHVGTLINAIHRDSTIRCGAIVTEVYEETQGGGALVFYQYKRRGYVLRPGQGDSYILVMPDKQLAPGVLVLDRINGVKPKPDDDYITDSDTWVLPPGDIVFTDVVEGETKRITPVDHHGLPVLRKVMHCGQPVDMAGDERFYSTWQCNSHWQAKIWATCDAGCYTGWCRKCYDDDTNGLTYE